MWMRACICGWMHMYFMYYRYPVYTVSLSYDCVCVCVITPFLQAEQLMSLEQQMEMAAQQSEQVKQAYSNCWVCSAALTAEHAHNCTSHVARPPFLVESKQNSGLAMQGFVHSVVCMKFSPKRQFCIVYNVPNSLVLFCEIWLATRVSAAALNEAWMMQYLLRCCHSVGTCPLSCDTMCVPVVSFCVGAALRGELVLCMWVLCAVWTGCHQHNATHWVRCALMALTREKLVQ